MSKRIKADPDISTRDEFHSVLDSVASDQILLEGLQLEREARLLAVREESEGEITTLQAQIKANVLRAEKFAAIHRGELFGKSKSAETNLTSYGFRLGNPTLNLLNRKWTWKTVLEAVKAAGLAFVNTKETLDKDSMKAQLSDEELAKYGCRIDQTETFFIDPKREAIPEPRLTSNGKEAI